jgi:hypothetical protein
VTICEISANGIDFEKHGTEFIDIYMKFWKEKEIDGKLKAYAELKE